MKAKVNFVDAETGKLYTREEVQKLNLTVIKTSKFYGNANGEITVIWEKQVKPSLQQRIDFCNTNP